jgi:hypothetical protein
VLWARAAPGRARAPSPSKPPRKMCLSLIPMPPSNRCAKRANPVESTQPPNRHEESVGRTLYVSLPRKNLEKRLNVSDRSRPLSINNEGFAKGQSDPSNRLD